MQTGNNLSAIGPRTDRKMANFMVVGNAALPFDVAIARYGTLGEQGPDAVGVQDAGDAPFVVVTAEHARMHGTLRRLIRADQGNTRAMHSEVARRSRSHQALTHDDILVMPLGHLLPPLTTSVHAADRIQRTAIKTRLSMFCQMTPTSRNPCIA